MTGTNTYITSLYITSLTFAMILQERYYHLKGTKAQGQFLTSKDHTPD